MGSAGCNAERLPKFWNVHHSVFSALMTVNWPSEGHVYVTRLYTLQHTHNLSRRSLLAKCIRLQGSLHWRTSLLILRRFARKSQMLARIVWGYCYTGFQQVGQEMHNMQNRVTWHLNWSAHVTEQLQKSRASSKNSREEPPQWISWKSRVIYSLVTGYRQTWSLHRAFCRLLCKYSLNHKMH